MVTDLPIARTRIRSDKIYNSTIAPLTKPMTARWTIYMVDILKIHNPQRISSRSDVGSTSPFMTVVAEQQVERPSALETATKLR